MAQTMKTKLSLATCLIAFVLATTVLLIISRHNPNPSKNYALGIAFFAGPYALLALSAWLCRASRQASFVALAVILLLAIGGVTLTSMEGYDLHDQMTNHGYYLFNPDGSRQYFPPHYQPMALFLVPIFEWLVVIAAMPVSLCVWWLRRSDHRISAKSL